jgi:hypothetical protein
MYHEFQKSRMNVIRNVEEMWNAQERDEFKVCKSVHHHTIQINHRLDATILPVYYIDIYLQINMFRASPRLSSGAQQLQWQPLDLPSELGDGSTVGCGRARVKPDAATAVVELLMMGVGIPETC